MSAVAWQQLARHADLSAGQAGGGRCGGAGAAGGDERLLRATRAMQLKDFEAASKLLSQEAAEKPDSFIVYDLRAACGLQSGRHEQALDDAMLCTKLNPDWARGWARLGAANLCLGRLRASLAAYRMGLQLDPSSREMQLGVQLAQQAQAGQAQDRRRAVHHP